MDHLAQQPDLGISGSPQEGDGDSALTGQQTTGDEQQQQQHQHRAGCAQANTTSDVASSLSSLTLTSDKETGPPPPPQQRPGEYIDSFEKAERLFTEEGAKDWNPENCEPGLRNQLVALLDPGLLHNGTSEYKSARMDSLLKQGFDSYEETRHLVHQPSVVRDHVIAMLDHCLHNGPPESDAFKSHLSSEAAFPIFRGFDSSGLSYWVELYSQGDPIVMKTSERVCWPDERPKAHLAAMGLRGAGQAASQDDAHTLRPPALALLLGNLFVSDSTERDPSNPTGYMVVVDATMHLPESPVWIIYEDQQRRDLARGQKKFIHWLKREDDPDHQCKEWDEDDEVLEYWDVDRFLPELFPVEKIFGGAMCLPADESSPCPSPTPSERDIEMTMDMDGNPRYLVANYRKFPHQPGSFYDAACIMTSYRQLGWARLADAMSLIQKTRCLVEFEPESEAPMPSPQRDWCRYTVCHADWDRYNC